MRVKKTIGKKTRAAGQAQDLLLIDQLISNSNTQLLKSLLASNDWLRVKPIFIKQLVKDFDSPRHHKAALLLAAMPHDFILECCKSKTPMPTKLLLRASQFIWNELEPELFTAYYDYFSKRNTVSNYLMQHSFSAFAPIEFIEKLRQKLPIISKEFT